MNPDSKTNSEGTEDRPSSSQSETHSPDHTSGTLFIPVPLQKCSSGHASNTHLGARARTHIVLFFKKSPQSLLPGDDSSLSASYILTTNTPAPIPGARSGRLTTSMSHFVQMGQEPRDLLATRGPPLSVHAPPPCQPSLPPPCSDFLEVMEYRGLEEQRRAVHNGIYII